MKADKSNKENKKREQFGYTLLEYVAGASVLLTVLYVGLNTMGENLSSFFESIGTWATEQSGNIGQTNQGDPTP